jgi:hypothetical protein
VNDLYSANLTKASLKVGESRIIAALLIDCADENCWRQAILEENVLQKRSVSTARTFADYIRHRLSTMNRELWELVREGSPTVATQALLAAAIKHNRLLADFFDLVLREHKRQFKTTLTARDWADYIEACAGRDLNVATWTPEVVVKLRQVVFRILAEAGYVENTRTMRLQHVTVAAPVVKYLEEAGEGEILRLMQVMS